MKDAIAPHGGTLVDRFAAGDQRERLLETFPDLPVITLDHRTQSDLELLAIGGFSPLEGFMTRADYESVVADMRLADGTVWPLPVTLPADAGLAARLREGTDVALRSPEGEALAVLHLEEKFTRDKRRDALQVYRTDDNAHPGIAYLYQTGDVVLGGRVSVLHRPTHLDFPDHRLDPVQTRKYFREKGWRRIVAFQTRNPIHRAHEYIQKCALEVVDGLLIHPLVGRTKSDDIPADVRMRCYETLIANYYPRERTLLSVFPASMRYAGPREAIFHALVRKNYGCTHFIVGRDHAGVGNYYGTFDAHHIFDEFEPGELGITPLFFDHTFYCTACEGMASSKTCPHDEDAWLILSGTKLREMLRRGEEPPHELTRPEVAQVLVESLQAAPGLA